MAHKRAGRRPWLFLGVLGFAVLGCQSPGATGSTEAASLDDPQQTAESVMMGRTPQGPARALTAEQKKELAGLKEIPPGYLFAMEEGTPGTKYRKSPSEFHQLSWVAVPDHEKAGCEIPPNTLLATPFLTRIPAPKHFIRRTDAKSDIPKGALFGWPCNDEPDHEGYEKCDVDPAKLKTLTWWQRKT